MFPARTGSPPKTLTPRLCPWLSRPLRELPPAFLCAIALPLLRFDRGNLQRGLVLPVALLPAIAFPSFLFENSDLFSAKLIDDLAGNFGIGHQRRADLDFAVVTDEQDIAQGHFFAQLPGQLFNSNDVAFSNAVLFAAGSNDCILHKIFLKSDF